MKTDQRIWKGSDGWTRASSAFPKGDAHLVLLFGATACIKDESLVGGIRQQYPNAQFLGSSTSGEICGTRVTQDTLVATVVRFEHTLIRGVQVDLVETPDCFLAAADLAQALPHSVFSSSSGEEAKLSHVFVLSDGLHVNGSELVRGLSVHLPAGISVTGGLAGDGERFLESYVLMNGAPAQHRIAALGFYGSRLKIGCGSLGGWEPIGPERLVTRSKGNVLFELDGQSALGQYKSYLRVQANDLPAAGLLFPLSLSGKGNAPAVVRTVLSVDEKAQSLTFAGDVPEGMSARFMKAGVDGLIDGAVGAAKCGLDVLGGESPDLAILISCVGRKLVLRERIEEEVEGVRKVLGERAVLAGYYSYGEIAPFRRGAKTELHNQTMTITTFAER
jgi:hypothetical protein